MKRKRKSPSPSVPVPPMAEAGKHKGLGKHPILVFVLIGLVFILIFLCQWLIFLTNSYFAAFVEHDATAAEAAANMDGLSLTVEEAEEQLALQRQWDLFVSSRLRDEVSVTAADGTILHGYFFNEESDTTVVVIPRFHLDGTADFLPGPWLYELTGCNILLPDPRAHGESGGDYFGFGCLEQYDLTVWLEWAEQAFGTQTFLLWGEGTGANTILLAAAHGLLPDSVACIVAESPYASLHQMAESSMWNWYQLPAFPFLPSIEEKLARSGAGYTVEDLELTGILAESGASVPVIFLNCTNDTYIRPEWTQTLYDAYPGSKELVTGGQSHGTVFAASREKIQSLAFFAPYLIK